MTGSDRRPIAADALALLEGDDGFGRQRFLDHRMIRLPLPETVRVVDARVEWQCGNVWSDSMDGLLTQFLELRHVESPPNRAARFAGLWGGFAICVHGLPRGHGPTDGVNEGCPNFVNDGLETVDVEVWRVFAQQAWLLLKLAEQFQFGVVAAPKDWEALAETWSRMEKLTVSTGFEDVCRSFANNPAPLARQLHLGSEGDRLREERVELAAMLSTWLTYGGVTPYLHWTEAEPKITLGGSGLFGALALELVWVAMSSARPTTLCSACGKSYEPTRRPRAREKHYCAECREKKEPVRQAKAALAARRRKAQEKQGITREKRPRVGGSKGPTSKR